jgi:predicted DNA-binding protein with PD1-like motif
MQINPSHNSRTRKALSALLLSAASALGSSLLPDCAFAQSDTKSTTQVTAPARNEKQSGSIEHNEAEGMEVFALRLRPGQDLRKEIERFAKERHIKAGFILTTVGSLETAALRLADQNSASTFAGKFEIVSLVGTLAQDGVHLHISLSDSAGRTIGGHLVEGCRVYTTAEIVIGEARGMVFTRKADKLTGFKELTIRPVRRPRKRR